MPICYTKDPTSYLTWGPNGAIAGHGREVQNIIAQVAKTDPGLIDAGFAAEAGAVKRMLTLPEAGRATEICLCGVWADPARRKAWTAGFQAFGGKIDAF